MFALSAFTLDVALAIPHSRALLLDKKEWGRSRLAYPSHVALSNLTSSLRPRTTKKRDDVPGITAARAYRWGWWLGRAVGRQVCCWPRRCIDWRPCCTLETIVAVVSIHFVLFIMQSIRCRSIFSLVDLTKIRPPLTSAFADVGCALRRMGEDDLMCLLQC